MDMFMSKSMVLDPVLANIIMTEYLERVVVDNLIEAGKIPLRR